MKLSDNAIRIFETLYSKENETIEQTMRRAAKAFATNEDEKEEAFQLQIKNIWRPNTPTYFNSNQKEKLYSACWVVPLEDSMNGIYDVANLARIIFSYGAGIGIPIGNLREKDANIYGSFDRTARCYTEPLDKIQCGIHSEISGIHDAHEYVDGNCKWCGKSEMPEGKSSGPIIFMKLYDAVAATTKSGGRARRAAILCCMPVWHPDILDFINCKEIDGTLSNMNISVSITDKFMQSLEDKIPFALHTPYDGSFIKNEDPELIWDSIANMAWKTADPGVLFIDTINYYNLLKKILLIQSPNPCGEKPMPGFFSCNLSHINLTKFIDSNEFDYDSLYDVTKKITRLMDNIIDLQDYPDLRFKETTQKYRPLGIGFMGLADAMFELGIKYNSKESKELVSNIAKTMLRASLETSALLAKERGQFGNYDIVKDDVEEVITKLLSPLDAKDKEILQLIKENGLRNCEHTTIAPTGTTAISCDCSYGIEPCFGLVWEKNLMTGDKMKFVNPIFASKFKNESWYTPELLDKIASNGGSLKNVRGIPREVKEIFVVAHDIKPKERIEIQAACQQHLSAAISATINLPADTTIEEIKDLYHYAYDLGLKGVTVYRDGCKKNQPVTFKKETGEVISHFVRPSSLPSVKHCIQLAEEKLYVDVVEYSGRVVEIWMEYGQAGHELNIILKGWGKTLSTALQHGMPLSEIVKQLKGMKGESPVWFRFDELDKKPTQLFSVPDALAKLLEYHYLKKKKEEIEGPITFEAETCPKCKSNTYIMVEGCATCSSCGFSKCS
jgi:ribonucleoside-diphosphate reductase alpha chain